MEAAQFLNIDLDVRSRRSLTPLAAAWPWAYQPMNADGNPDPHWLILHPMGRVKTAEAAAKELLQHISGLRGAARQCWRTAHRRTFDIGVQAGGNARAFEAVQLTAALRRIATAGAQLQLTAYPVELESRFVIPKRRAAKTRR